MRWLKPEGSEVKVGEPIAEIETDKAVVEFESYASGILRKILVVEGATVPVGQAIAIVGEAEEELPEPAVEVTEEKETPAEEEEVASRQAVMPSASAGEARASPLARRLAEERGIDIAQIEGTGPGGRVTKEDVLNFAAATPAAEVEVPPAVEAEAAAPVGAAAGERVPLSRMRQQIARVTVRSKQEKPHFYVSSDVDMTRAMELRQQVNQLLQGEGVRVSVNDLIIKSCVEALKKYPKFNAYFHENGLQFNDRINIGVAIAEEEGLIVPAIIDCAQKPLKDIAMASKDLAERARKGTLHSNEYTGGTFTISNLGMFDVSSFVAIIVPPQTAVLAVGSVTKKPVARDDQVVIAQMMTATLSSDHRVVDGAESARFMVEVKRLLENPVGLLVGEIDRPS